MATVYYELPTDLPVPEDDGAADHLVGLSIPPVSLQATNGETVDLSALAGRTVVYVYPKTGQPGTEMPDGWDAIPGARGCTPQSCAFRDHHADLAAAGADRVFGLSTQSTAYQSEAVARLHLPFAILSDDGFALGDAIGFPDFKAEGERLYKRMALVIDDGVITKCFYPVFPPDRNAADVLAWLQDNPRVG
jgi:peroxiredoxin